MANWSESKDIEILQRLGILEKGKTESEEEGEVLGMVTASEGDSDDDSPVLFDRDRLLRNSLGGRGSILRNNRMNGESGFALAFRGLLVCTAFFTIGLCLSLVGPTLPDLQSKTNATSLRSVMTVICANGFGAILGISFGGGCYGCVNPFCVMTLSLFLCAGTTLIIPWLSNLALTILVFILQGISLGFLERGGYSIFYAYWRRRYHVIQLFYFALAVGALVSPLVTTPFVFDKYNTTMNMIVNNSYQDAIPPLLTGESASPERRRVYRDNQVVHNDTDSAQNTNYIDYNATSSRNEGLTTPFPPQDTAPPKKPELAEGNVNTEEKYTKQKEKDIAAAEEAAKTAASTSVNPNPTVAYDEASERVENSSFVEASVPSDTGATSPPVVGNTTVTYPTTEATSATTTNTTATTATSTLPPTTTTPPPVTTNPPPAVNHLFTERHSSPTTEVSAISPNTSLASSNASEPSSGGTPPPRPGVVEEAEKEIWDYVLENVAKINRVKFAYLVVAIMSTLSTVGFVLMCCCMPCRTLRLPPMHPDDFKFNVHKLCSSRHILGTTLLGLLLGFFAMGMESTVYNFLTVYMMKSYKGGQLQAVFLTTVFWLGMAVIRLFVAFSTRLIPFPVVISVSLVGTLLVSAVLSIVSTESPTVLWLGTGGLGLFIGPIFPVTYCWLDKQLGLSPWVSSIWLCVAHLGRIVVPPVAGAVMELQHSPKVIILSLLVCSLLSGITWFFLQRIARLANQMLAVDAFSRQLKQAGAVGDPFEPPPPEMQNGTGYSRMVDVDELDEEENDGLEMDHLDDFLADPKISGSASKNDWASSINDGIFGNYVKTNSHKL